jgi:hypothetical protein
MLDAMHGLIRALQETGELDAAIAVAQRLLQLDPEEVLAHTSLSILYQHKGMIAEAEAEALKAKLLGWKKQLRQQKPNPSPNNDSACIERPVPHEAARNLRNFHDQLMAAYGPQQWWPAQTPLEVIVGAYLTQNTSWRGVERSIANLVERGMMNLDGLRSIPAKKSCACSFVPRATWCARLQPSRRLSLFSIRSTVGPWPVSHRNQPALCADNCWRCRA